MAAKGKKSSKGPIKVAKRGEEKAADVNLEDSGALQQEHVSDEQPTKEEPRRSRQSSRPSSRQVSGVNPRKVSEGLKQLPPDAYRFVRESYLMLDSDGSGGVTRETMKDMLASLGLRDSNDRMLDAMLKKSGEPITFAGYLAVMGELLADLPSREELDIMVEAFQSKDGSLNEPDLKQALLAEGLTLDEIEAVMRRFTKPTRHGEIFDAKAFAAAMSV